MGPDREVSILCIGITRYPVRQIHKIDSGPHRNLKAHLESSKQVGVFNSLFTLLHLRLLLYGESFGEDADADRWLR